MPAKPATPRCRRKPGSPIDRARLDDKRAGDADAEASGDWPDAANASGSRDRHEKPVVVERLETPGTVNFDATPQRYYTIVGVSESRNRRGPFAGPIQVALHRSAKPAGKSGRLVYSRRDLADLAIAAEDWQW